MLAELVLFDMDGVLADTEPIHAAATREVLLREGTDVPLDEIASFIGSTDTRMFEELKRRYSLSDPVERYVDRKQQAVLARLALGLPPNPGVCETLLKLAMIGVPAVVASGSGPRVVEAVVRALGLERSFRALFSAAEVERPKPAPDLFLHAARRMGAVPKRCLVIEDSPLGIAAGKAAGMRVVAVLTPSTRDLDLSAADEVLESLDAFDVERLVEGM